MKRLLYVITAILAFSIGSAFSIYFQFRSRPMSKSDCSWAKHVSGESSSHILNTKSRLGQEVDFYHESTSPEVTRYLFEANSEGDELVERGFKLNADGQRVGERGVIVFPNGVARIYWTEGNEFWFIQASSLKLARKVENQCFAQ